MVNPDILSIRDRRVVMMREPEDHEPLDPRRLIQFTGEEDVEGRRLIEDPLRLHPSHGVRTVHPRDIEKRTHREQ